MADFQSASSNYQAEEINIIAGSVDPLDKTKKLIEKLGLTFPVAHSMDGVKTSAIIGAYYENDKNFIQPTGFIIRPDNTIAVACYSSGPVGRFAANNVLNLIKYYKSQKK